MPDAAKIDTHQKALSINLDASAFGSFAEIGAGQEVARWFLTVGGASGTVAKTISAYDKEVSDDLYGGGTRYVSQPRLQAMMEAEWKQLLAELQASRGAHTRFFAFVDTISARNFSGTNECHGWMGLRFQLEPGAPPNDVILHVNLRDPTNLQQQEAVGILGVNLLHAAHHSLGSAEDFLAALCEDLKLDRIEIDLVQLAGPAFQGWDTRLLHLLLVAKGYAEAVAFGADGSPIDPSDLLYKKALVLAPGGFETVTNIHSRLISATLEQIPNESLHDAKGKLGMFCLSCTSPFPSIPTPTVEHLAQHVEALRQVGYGTLVFRERELYNMSAFVSRYTKFPVQFAVGLSVLIFALQDRYRPLSGALLEATGRLFMQHVKLCVYPMEEEALKARLSALGINDWTFTATQGMVYAENLVPPEPLGHLYRYLIGCNFIVPVHPPAASAGAPA